MARSHILHMISSVSIMEGNRSTMFIADIQTTHHTVERTVRFTFQMVRNILLDI